MTQSSPFSVVRSKPRLPRSNIPVTRFRLLLTSDTLSRPPTSKDIPDIARRLAIVRNAPCPLYRSRSGIVCRQREMNHAEPIQHLSQIPRRTGHIGERVKPIANPQFLGRGRHQLTETGSACLADGKWIVAGFCPNQRVEQSGGQAELRFRSIDMRQVCCPDPTSLAPARIAAARRLNVRKCLGSALQIALLWLGELPRIRARLVGSRRASGRADNRRVRPRGCSLQ
jgi:hypothetical protein